MPWEERLSKEVGNSEAVEWLEAAGESVCTLSDCVDGEKRSVVSVSRNVKDEDKVGEHKERRFKWRGLGMVTMVSL